MMSRVPAILKVFLFLLLVLSSYIWTGYKVTAMTGGAKKTHSGKVDISPEGGEKIFWGRGRCFTCHSLGDRGSAVRCPNLGQFGEKFLLPIGLRAVERAKLRSKQTGKTYTRTDYLVESVTQPDAFLAPGYKNEMEIVYAPPISLTLDDVKAVISFLQTQGGELEMDAIDHPSAISQGYFDRIAASKAGGGGDPGSGEEIFADNCAECHKINGEGGSIGPDLSLAGTLDLDFLKDSILLPGKKISKNYETYTVIAKADGRRTVGLKTRDTASEIDITTATGEVVTLTKNNIAKITVDPNTSLMPADMNEALTVKDFQDVLAYLMLQKGASGS